jgi:hypothetical protein
MSDVRYRRAEKVFGSWPDTAGKPVPFSEPDCASRGTHFHCGSLFAIAAAYALLLAWNFSEEIMNNLKRFSDSGGNLSSRCLSSESSDRAPGPRASGFHKIRRKEKISMEVKRIVPSFSDQRGDIIDVLAQNVVEYATIITSKKFAVRANRYHKETFQWVYMLNGRMGVVARMPDEQPTELILETGDLIVNVPLEHHAFEALEDSTMLVLTRGPRGKEDYEKDTYRLEMPLITPRS